MHTYKITLRQYDRTPRSNDFKVKTFKALGDEAAMMKAYALYLGCTLKEILQEGVTAEEAKDSLKCPDISDTYVVSLQNLETKEFLVDNRPDEEED